MSILPSAYSDSGDIFSSRLKRIQEELRKSAEEQFQVDEIDMEDANATSQSVLKWRDEWGFVAAKPIVDAAEMPEEPSFTDPQFWYRFDHRGKKLYDQSHFDQHADIFGNPKFMHGVDWGAFGDEMCWDCNGIDVYASAPVSINNKIVGLAAFSIVFLIYPKDLAFHNGRHRVILNHVEDGAALYCKKIEVGPDGKVYFSLRINGVNKLFETAAATVGVNGWYWGILTFNGTVCTCYINGVAKTVNTSTHNPFFSGQALTEDEMFMAGTGTRDNFLELDGLSQYITCSTGATLWNAALTSFSFSLWIRPAIVGGDGNYREVVQRGWATNSGFDLYFYNTLKRLYFELASTYPTRISTIYYDFTNLPVDKWYLVTVVYDSTLGVQRSKIYVNGNLGVQTTDNAGVALNNANALFIAGSLNDFSGRVKDFRWWTNLALNQSKVTALYNSGINGALDPIVNAPSYWLKMDEGVGNPLDAVSGTLTATLVNTPVWETDRLGLWKGGLQDLRMYRRVLTQTEATNINTNKISVSPIAYGKVATVGGSAFNE